jgi:outer membrane receptor for ferrienterochelin and colicins
MKTISSLLITALITPLLAVQDIDAYFSMPMEDLLNLTIISSTGTPSSLSDAPSIATVITAKQIERSSARTLDEVLAMVPGLHVNYTGAYQRGGYDIRGISATTFNSQILTLINGTSIDKLETGSPFQRFTFPASAIQRVEVIRGPGSAVYGADAFAGVVNIITKDAYYLSTHSQAGVRYGTYNQSEVFGNYGEIYENGINLGLNLSYISSDGDNRRVVHNDVQTTFDTLFGTNASLAPSTLHSQFDVFNLNMNLSFEKFSMNLWSYLQQDNGTGAGAANALDNKGDITGNYFIVDLNHNSYSSSTLEWNNKLTLSYLEEISTLHLFPSGATLPIGDDGNFFTPGGGLVTFTEGAIGIPTIEEHKIALESTLNISIFDNHQIRLSTGVISTDLIARESLNFGPSVLNGTEGSVDGSLTDVSDTPFTFIPNVNRTILFLSAQDEYKLSSTWNITAGLRYDHYSDFGNTINPRVGLVWHNSKAFTTKLLYGRAFRAPSAGELYFKNNPGILGNKELSPETINTVELGTTYSPNTHVKSSINFYWYEADNLIINTPDSTGARIAKNIGAQHGAGIELESIYKINHDILISADYAYRWTKNETTKTSVKNVPIHIAHAMFDWAFFKYFYLNSEIFIVADTPRELGDAREKVKDYQVVNSSFGYKISQHFETSISARNLFDVKYYHPSDANPVGDYPIEGFNIFATLKYRF